MFIRFIFLYIRICNLSFYNPSPHEKYKIEQLQRNTKEHTFLFFCDYFGYKTREMECYSKPYTANFKIYIEYLPFTPQYIAIIVFIGIQ